MKRRYATIPRSPRPFPVLDGRGEVFLRYPTMGDALRAAAFLNQCGKLGPYTVPNPGSSRRTAA
jgi:hypothetical protein